MSKQTFRLPTWRRKPTADETAPDRKLKALLADERFGQEDADEADS